MDAAQKQHENSRPWLQPHNFPPGVSGNPGGRPKGRSLTAIIREVLDSNSIKGKPLPEGRTVADVLAEVFVAEALKGKFPFAKEVIDRTEGKVVDRLEVGGKDGGPLAVTVQDQAAAAKELEAWRAEQSTRLSNSLSVQPTPPTSSTPTG